MKQFFLLMAVIVLGGAALRFCAARMQGGQASGAPPVLTPEEARARLEENPSAILLDVRTQEEYDSGHIPGAVCLPNEDIQAEMPMVFDKDAEILVYCRSGRRSAEAAAKLIAMGCTNVSDFGGILSWPYETTTD